MGWWILLFYPERYRGKIFTNILSINGKTSNTVWLPRTNSDMSNSTNTVVHIDGKGGNLYLRLRARAHTIFVAQAGCSILQSAKFEQAITHQVLLRREILVDEQSYQQILCLHVLIARHIFINFSIC